MKSASSASGSLPRFIDIGLTLPATFLSVLLSLVTASAQQGAPTSKEPTVGPAAPRKPQKDR
jgi:hypothetical protein